MSVLQKDWQTTRLNIKERTTFMLKNDLFSDVKFVVRQSDGESESRQVIPAHKFVLSIGSPVFEGMFYGELAETRDSIELPDCEYESLLELFRYMYSDEVNLSGSNVMRVLYLAKKYMVPSLAEKCTIYLQENLDPSNVFSILPAVEKYEEKSLVDRCWEMIDDHTEAALKSDTFVTIERSLLEALVQRDTLSIAEVELFKGVIRWATKQSQRQGIVADGQQMRTILGERIVKAIRFPLMTQDEFSSVVLFKSNILKVSEVFYKRDLNSVQNFPVGFPKTKRVGLRRRCSRFSLVKFGWINNGKSCSLPFSLSRNTDLRFHGVYVFGSKDNDYSISFTLKNDLIGTVLTSREGTFLSVPHTSGKYHGFDVLFKEPILLRKGGVYCLEARISGPPSWYGTQGKHSVQCSDATLTFWSTNEGQFGEFICSHFNPPSSP